jgi:hypothetical protein
MNKILVALVILFALCACSKPVPPEKSAYVGEWQQKNMYLLITQEGQLTYKRVDGHTTTSMDVPIKRFDGDNIEAGIGPMSSVFVVSKPPYQDGGKWKMVVDGVELTRTVE